MEDEWSQTALQNVLILASCSRKYFQRNTVGVQIVGFGPVIETLRNWLRWNPPQFSMLVHKLNVDIVLVYH